MTSDRIDTGRLDGSEPGPAGHPGPTGPSSDLGATVPTAPGSRAPSDDVAPARVVGSSGPIGLADGSGGKRPSAFTPGPRRADDRRIAVASVVIAALYLLAAAGAAAAVATGSPGLPTT